MDKTKTLPVHISVHSSGAGDIKEKSINALCMKTRQVRRRMMKQRAGGGAAGAASPRGYLSKDLKTVRQPSCRILKGEHGGRAKRPPEVWKGELLWHGMGAWRWGSWWAAPNEGLEANFSYITPANHPSSVESVLFTEHIHLSPFRSDGATPPHISLKRLAVLVPAHHRHPMSRYARDLPLTATGYKCGDGDIPKESGNAREYVPNQVQGSGGGCQ